MLIFMIFIALMFIGIGYFINIKFNKKHISINFVIGIISFIIGFFGTMFIIETMLKVQVKSDKDYQNKLLEKQSIECMLKEQDNIDIIENELLYSKIIEFNKNLREIKKGANSPWTNWCYNQNIANNIDYINMELILKGLY